MPKNQNVYQTGDAGIGEAVRLAALRVPDEFSCQVLGAVKGKAVLDVGAGTNTYLGDWVNDPVQGGRYFVIDPWGAAQAAQKAAGHTIVEGAIQSGRPAKLSITGLLLSDSGIIDDQFDVGHARFVLCHVPAALRVQGIKGLLRVSRERIIIIEHIGATVGGSPGADAFKEALRGIQDDPDIPFSTFYEDHLPGQVEAAVAGRPYRIEQQVLRLPEGPRFMELIIGAEHLMLPILKGKPRLEAKMNHAVTLLRAEMKESKQRAEAGHPPIHLHAPDLMAVIVHKQRG